MAVPKWYYTVHSLGQGLLLDTIIFINRRSLLVVICVEDRIILYPLSLCSPLSITSRMSLKASSRTESQRFALHNLNVSEDEKERTLRRLDGIRDPVDASHNTKSTSPTDPNEIPVLGDFSDMDSETARSKCVYSYTKSLKQLYLGYRHESKRKATKSETK